MTTIHRAFRAHSIPRGRSLVIKRSVVIGGHKTSVSLEDGFWKELRRFADEDCLWLGELIGDIDAGRRNKANLSSSCRLYVVDRLKAEIEFLLDGPTVKPRRIPMIREHAEAP